MISISEKRYGELVANSVRVAELEQELARLAKSFEMQTDNVRYWKKAAEDARFKHNDALNELFKWQTAFIETEIKLNAMTVEFGNLKFRHTMALEASERILKTYTNLGKPGAE